MAPTGTNGFAPIGFAHRGARANAPENTLEAFSLALEMGATGLESDVWLTSDGVPVLQHDGVVLLGSSEILVSELRRDELPAAIPTLRELYEACGTQVPLSLDVKEDAAALPTLRVAREVGALEQLWLCHWNWKALLRWRDEAGGARLVDSTSTHVMSTPADARAARMQKLGIHAINMHHTQWHEATVDVFHARGRLVLGWDAQDDASLERLVRLGVDGLFSDHVPRMMDVLTRTASGS